MKMFNVTFFTSLKMFCDMFLTLSFLNIGMCIILLIMKTLIILFYINDEYNIHMAIKIYNKVNVLNMVMLSHFCNNTIILLVIKFTNL